MKLYSKEDFLKAAEFCEVSMIDANYILERIDEVAKPIVIPSEDEINKHYSKIGDIPFGNAVVYEVQIILRHIKKRRFNKIQGGNK